MSVRPYITTGVAIAGAGILLTSGSALPLPGGDDAQPKLDVAQKTLTLAEASVMQAAVSTPSPLAVLGFIPASTPGPGVVFAPGFSGSTGPRTSAPQGGGPTMRIVSSNLFAPDLISLTVPQTGGGGATPNRLLAALTGPDGASSARSMAMTTAFAPALAPPAGPSLLDPIAAFIKIFISNGGPGENGGLLFGNGGDGLPGQDGGTAGCSARAAKGRRRKGWRRRQRRDVIRQRWGRRPGRHRRVGRSGRQSQPERHHGARRCAGPQCHGQRRDVHRQPRW